MSPSGSMRPIPSGLLHILGRLTTFSPPFLFGIAGPPLRSARLACHLAFIDCRIPVFIGTLVSLRRRPGALFVT